MALVKVSDDFEWSSLVLEQATLVSLINDDPNTQEELCIDLTLDGLWYITTRKFTAGQDFIVGIRSVDSSEVPRYLSDRRYEDFLLRLKYGVSSVPYDHSYQQLVLVSRCDHEYFTRAYLTRIDDPVDSPSELDVTGQYGSSSSGILDSTNIVTHPKLDLRSSSCDSQVASDFKNIRMRLFGHRFNDNFITARRFVVTRSPANNFKYVGCSKICEVRLSPTSVAMMKVDTRDERFSLDIPVASKGSGIQTRIVSTTITEDQYLELLQYRTTDVITKHYCVLKVDETSLVDFVIYQNQDMSFGLMTIPRNLHEKVIRMGIITDKEVTYDGAYRDRRICHCTNWARLGAITK